MTSLPKLRAFAAAVQNDPNRPRRLPDTQERQVPSPDTGRQHRDSLLRSYLGRGARLASFDSYNDDGDSLNDEQLVPFDTRCPLIAEDDDELPHTHPQNPAVLYVAPSAQCPTQAQQPYNRMPSPVFQPTIVDAETTKTTMENGPESKPTESNSVHGEVIASPSRSLDKFPSSPSHGYPCDDRVNTMSTECSSQQPPAYSVTENEVRRPVVQSPLHRFRSAVVGVQASMRVTRAERLKKKAKWASKKLFVFTLSKVGLTCVVVMYVIFGAFLFQHLEGGDPLAQASEGDVSDENADLDLDPGQPQALVQLDPEAQEEIKKLRSQYVESMWNTTNRLNVLYFELWHNAVRSDVEKFERQFLEILRKYSVFEKPTQESPSVEAPAAPVEVQSEQEKNWSYATALLFCVAIITTIGYGDIVPKTPEGKVACMLYGLIGIPMMLLCLANIGHFLAVCFRFMFQQFRHLCLVKEKDKTGRQGFKNCKVRVPIWVTLLTLFIYLMTGASLFSGWEGWSFLDGSYFVFVTLSTIGFGDLVPGKGTNTLDSNAQRVVCALYLLFGLSLVSMTFQLIQEYFRAIMARYAEFFGLTKEQLDKDKVEGDTCTIDGDGVDVEENRRKLLGGGRSSGPASTSACSDVVVVGDPWGNLLKKQRESARSPSIDVGEDRGGESKKGISRESSLRDGLERQGSSDNKASQDCPFADGGGSDSQASPRGQQQPSGIPESPGSAQSPGVDEASRSLLALFKKRKSGQPVTTGDKGKQGQVSKSKSSGSDSIGEAV